MAMSGVVKNFRDGTILIEDGTTPTALAVTVQYEAGDFATEGFNESQHDVTVYPDRGDFGSLRKTNQKYPTFSFTAHMTDLSDATDKLLWNIVNKTGAFASAKSTSGTTADVYTVDITWTVEGTNFGDSADHSLKLEDCRLEISVSEGDPSSFSISGTCYGAITAT